MAWGVELDGDGNLARIDGEKVVKVATIGYGAQHTVLLAATEAGKYYIVESGTTSEGQYTEVLSELNEIESAFVDPNDVVCPKCGSYDWDEIDKELYMDGSVVVRAKCNGCGAKFSFAIVTATPVWSVELDE